MKDWYYKTTYDDASRFVLGTKGHFFINALTRPEAKGLLSK